MDILVLGAGAWGTALAISAGARHRVTLWARDAGQAAALEQRRENLTYLSGFRLPQGVTVAGPDAGTPGALAEGQSVPISWLRGARQARTRGSSCTRRSRTSTPERARIPYAHPPTGVHRAPVFR